MTQEHRRVLKTYKTTGSLLVSALCVVLFWPRTAAKGQIAPEERVEAGTAATLRNKEAAATAFKAMVPVLRHPRCINCHDTGDYPRQGDDNHPHIMDVRRGPDGHGANGVRCSTCHQDHNLPGVHMPPGAPDWALPPPATPMIWRGLTDGQLCTLFKDPAQNGHRSVAQIVEHMKTPLVLWGWHPGDGRAPIPTSESAFQRSVESWASHGAACPADDKAAPADRSRTAG